MFVEVPQPSNWQDFERLCLVLWRSIWNDLNAQCNGRNGQSQNGVDVFGQPQPGIEWHGVQCKGKENFSIQQLTTEEIDREVRNATNFQPNISHFILATTAPRDVNIQEYVRTQFTNGVYPFRVTVWSWHDIQQELNLRKEVLKTLYNDLGILGHRPQPEADNKIEFIAYKSEPIDRLDAMLSRDEIRSRLSETLRADIRNVLIELALNAYTHGSASNVKVIFEMSKIIIEDDGSAFDPTKHDFSHRPLGRRGVGLMFLKLFIKKYSEGLSVLYDHTDNGLNRLTLEFSKPLSTRQFNHTCQIVTASLVASHAQAIFVAERADIPTNCPVLYYHVDSTRLSVSAFYDFLNALLRRIPNSSRLKLSFADNDLLKQSLEWWIREGMLEKASLLDL